MLLHCVRHGQSTYNAENRIQGQSDVPLSELGWTQARALAQALAEEPIERVFASPLRRALDTARLLSEACRVPLEVLPDLAELHAGVFQDRAREELDELYPEAIAAWTSGDPDYAIPGGESRRDLMRRGAAAFAEIVRRPYDEVAVVSHGGLLAAAFKSLLDIPAALNPFRLENASVSCLELDGEKTLLLTLNDVAHLDGIGLAGRGDL